MVTNLLVIIIIIIASHCVKINEKEIIKYLDSVKKLKKPVTVIPILLVALGMVSKGLEKRLNEQENRERTESI